MLPNWLPLTLNDQGQSVTLLVLCSILHCDSGIVLYADIMNEINHCHDLQDDVDPHFKYDATHYIIGDHTAYGQIQYVQSM